LIDYLQHMPQLTEWMFQEWDVMLGQKTPEARIKELNAHMNRDQLPIAWVAHANGRLLGSAALRVHDIEGHEHLTPWLGGVYIGPQFRRRGIGAALCTTVEEAARSRGVQTLYLFTLDKQAWYSRQGWTVLAPCVWHERPGEIMSKRL
jgi:N-acetylglutamate synthase-like GNAT family acetyltransferase